MQSDMATQEMRIPGRGSEAADVERAARGDHEAFERLYRCHVGRVHALCLRIGDADSAADLTQEVFVRAWRKLSTFRGEAAFGTWLYRIALNTLFAHRETKKKERSRWIEDDGLVERLPGRPKSGDLRVDLERALPELPQGARQIFVLHDVEGFKHEEIAEHLGISVGTSKSQLHRARLLLRALLQR
jgi:RNA polymerase sigma-70 factor (ECF subfamily)